MFSTTFEFILPKGFIDESGEIHRHGIMRLSTGLDEILVQKDQRIQENSAYKILIILSRVICNLGHLSMIQPELLEQLFIIDLIYLQEFFMQIHQPNLGEFLSGEC
jgi:hypothetical protein